MNDRMTCTDSRVAAQLAQTMQQQETPQSAAAQSATDMADVAIASGLTSRLVSQHHSFHNSLLCWFALPAQLSHAHSASNDLLHGMLHDGKMCLHQSADPQTAQILKLHGAESSLCLGLLTKAGSTGQSFALLHQGNYVIPTPTVASACQNPAVLTTLQCAVTDVVQVITQHTVRTHQLCPDGLTYLE